MRRSADETRIIESKTDLTNVVLNPVGVPGIISLVTADFPDNNRDGY